MILLPTCEQAGSGSYTNFGGMPLQLGNFSWGPDGELPGQENSPIGLGSLLDSSTN